MRYALLLSAVLVSVSIVSASSLLEQAPDQNRHSASIVDLPDIQPEYKVDPYIRAAIALQALGKEQACRNLLVLAKDKKNGHGVFVLCRMLFTSKPFARFVRPSLGAPFPLGNTEGSDWPLEPIEIVDGVPFLITRGYLIGGEAESPISYLEYCIHKCQWNCCRFQRKSDLEKCKALEKLISSNKWKPPLDGLDREFFESQIK